MRFVRDLVAGLVAFVATSLTLLSWHSFTSDFWRFSWQLLVIGAVVLLAGTLARAIRAPWAVVLLCQLVPGFVVGHLELTGHPLPIGSGWSALRVQIDAASAVIERLLPPVPAHHGIAPLLLAGALLAYAVTDLLAVTLRRPALAGLPLLAAYAAGFGVVGGSGPWLGFIGVVAGFLMLVFLTEVDRVERWGRRIGDDTGRGRLVDGALRVGMAATVLALFVPAVIPVLHLDLVGIGPGAGDHGKITVTNPMIDVQQSLVQRADTPLLEVHTTDPDPSYMRIAVLTTFDNSQWTTGARSVPVENDAEGAVPLAGVADPQAVATVDYQVHALDDFRSRWLPTRAPITSISASGDWRYDSSTTDFLAVPKDLTTANETYHFTAALQHLDSQDLVRASPGTAAVGTRYLELPANFPQSVVSTARRVTQHATTSFAEAVALQDWFRTTGHFTYSTSVNLGSGPQAIANFVGTGPGSRVGYCQQYAAAMASMARALGIPARVAVGFLRPTQTGPDTWVYSSRDMHAWPELYFNGFGWVRFEPTPAIQTDAPPSYTLGIGNGPTLPSTTASASVSSSPSTTTPTNKPRETPNTTAAGSGSRVPWLLIACSTLGMLALVGLLLLPATVRRARRRRRSSGDAVGAWDEVRDTVVDLGLSWPEGRSPRAAALTLPVPPPEHAALLRIVEAVETARYSPRTAAVEPADLLQVLTALAAGASRWDRLRATCWPRSVLSRVRPEVDALVG